jgi:hypothetical protein
MNKKLPLFVFLLCMAISSEGQELQVRHSVDPKLNDKNFPMVDFKYFKELDTMATGSFLIELQSFLNGEKSNIGQAFIQATQNIKFWKPKIYLSCGFSGGVGVAIPSYGYYIANSYSIGISYPLVFPRTWFSFNILYRYTAILKPSHDPQLTIYLGGGQFNYKLMYSCSFVSWFTNKDNGLPGNEGKKGKKYLFYADPQIWYGIGKKYSIGSRVSVYYHLFSDENTLKAYPTIGIKRGF